MLYRGLGAVVLGAAPALALHFAGYEAAKTVLGSDHSTFNDFSAGICGQVCGSLCWVPMDVVKERLQVEGQLKVTRPHGSSLGAFSQILRCQGLLGLYRALPIHQVTWGLFSGIYLATYEQCKSWCIDAGHADENDKLEPTAQLCSVVSASVLAAFVTNPLDVLKTRLQVAQSSHDMFP